MQGACQRFALAASGWDADKAWEQKKLEAREMLEKRGESHLSAARFVGQFLTLRLTGYFYHLSFEIDIL